jgi:uncharacterized protein
MPPVEEIAGPRRAADLARLCNHEIAEIVAKYPDRFVAAAANVPLSNMDTALKETERAIKDRGFKGIQIYSRVNGKARAPRR